MTPLEKLVATAYKCGGWKMFPDDVPKDGSLIIYQNSEKVCGVGYHLTFGKTEGVQYAWKDISYIPLPYLSSIDRMTDWFTLVFPANKESKEIK